MRAAKTLFLSLAPLMITESLPLILVTVLYEFDIIHYLFFGHPTRPVPPSRRKLDCIGFLPIPEKAKSWQGSLVAVLCGLVWFFSEFTLDIILIILGVDSAAEPKKQIQQHEEQLQHDEDNDTAVVQDSYTEEDGTGVKTNKMHHHHHHHHHHHRRDIYDNSEEFFGDHQPQQQQHGGRRWRREVQREDESAYDASEEGDDVFEQLDLQDEFLGWSSMERSVEYRDEEEVLFVVSAALSRKLTLAKEGDEGKAVLSSTAPDVDVSAAVDVEGERKTDLQENGERTPEAEIRLLPAHDLERNVDFHSNSDTDADADADVDTEAAEEPRSVSSSPLSSTSTSCTDHPYETEHNDEKEKTHTKGDYKENTKAWVQLSVSTRTAKAPTLDDCRTTTFIRQHGDDQESAASVHEHPAEQQSQDQWSEWGPHQLSRAVKTVQSTQRQKQERVVTSPSRHRHMALFPPLSTLAAESTAESLSDDGRIRHGKKKMLRYAKKKAAKAKKASGTPSSPTTGGVPSPVEDDRLSA